MAQEGIPTFHNFFDFVTPLKEEIKQQPLSAATDTLVKSRKNLTLTEEVGLEELPVQVSQSSSLFEESASAPISDSRGSSSQMDMDALDSSRLFKKSRVEKLDDIKRGYADPTTDDLNFTMQPPRILSKSSTLHPLLKSKSDVPAVTCKPRDHAAPASFGMFGPGSWTSQKTAHEDIVVATYSKDRAAAPLLHISPADEGSRTGLKGSSFASLLNKAMAGGSGLSLGRSKSSRGGGSESTFVASQEAAPITRQLTIFYGGQAHVFEDVSSDKAEAIMTLAGSSGRSWSTVYSPQPKSSMPVSVSEGSLSTFERERSKPSSMTAFENNLGVSTEIHNTLSSLLHKRK